MAIKDWNDYNRLRDSSQANLKQHLALTSAEQADNKFSEAVLSSAFTFLEIAGVLTRGWRTMSYRKGPQTLKTSIDIERWKQLSFDHETKGMRLVEGFGKLRSENAFGRLFQNSDILGVDMIDLGGLGNISLKGPFLDKKFNPLPIQQQMNALDNIIHHINRNTAVDTTIIDTLGLSDEVKILFKDAFKNSDKIIYFLE